MSQLSKDIFVFHVDLVPGVPKKRPAFDLM